MSEKGVDLKVLSVGELKAMAFDTILVLERAKMNLQALQTEIAQRPADENKTVNEEDK